MGRNGEETATLILGALRREGRPLTAYDLLRLLRQDGISAPPTIYRALRRLKAAGQVQRIETLNAYVANRIEDGRPAEKTVSTVFAICDQCGAVDAIRDTGLDSLVQADVRARGFLIRSVTIELPGLCSSCQQTAAGPASGSA